MSVVALTNAFCYIDNHDFTGDANEITLGCSANKLDGTNFRSAGWRVPVGGLKDTKLDVKGWWQVAATNDSVDADLFTDLGVTNLAATVAAVETETSPAWMFQLEKGDYSEFGKVGDLAPFAVSAMATNSVGVLRGQLAKALGTVSATGALGSGCQLGAVSSTQKLYATFHITGAPGTTITVLVQSATANTFVGATTRATIGPLTAAGGTWLTPVAGPVTDTWWRFNVSAITGTFTVAGALAIQ